MNITLDCKRRQLDEPERRGQNGGAKVKIFYLILGEIICTKLPVTIIIALISSRSIESY